MLAPLRELATGAPTLREALVSTELDAPALQAAMLVAALDEITREQRVLARHNGPSLDRCVDRLDAAWRELRDHNADWIVQSIRKRFRERVARADLPVAQLDRSERTWKRDYNRGRRALENEFGKVMRFKSIRELAAGNTGLVLADMKPVWLMSPLSVSDTLPLDLDAFDVVIFDEASQIPLEEAVPALFRARQSIIVGDEQQLPPTNFFSSSRDSEEEDDRAATFELDSDSLLNQAARALQSTLLSWHYRSRSESLIDFCNAAFYAGDLLTIPDASRAVPADPIEVANPDEGDTRAADVLARPVGFHFIEKGVYANRRNARESTYIAHLVRGLLKDDSNRSIGVVAFSEAQQEEIEDALRRLAESDNAFAEQLEAEMEREEDDQFVGHFVKNLENVQGDERDVIILSICYGYDATGKMRMNFGPINKHGGEKRLNVVFSRARRHMVVVSSIRHAAITNDYNTGAATLKRYLRYAECCSVGDEAAARRVVGEFEISLPTDTAPDDVIESVAAAIEEEGFVVDRGVGASRLRVDLAAYRLDDSRYRLGILVDTDAHYSGRDRVEQHLIRPSLLRAFDWPLLRVFCHDWYNERDAVLGRIRHLLA